MDILNFENNDEKIEVEQFRVDKNILQFADFTLNIPNISYFYSGKIEVNYPIGMYLIIGIIGLIILMFVPLVGVLILVILAGLVYLKYREKMNSNQYISFVTNSGRTYSINMQDNDFLKRVVNTVQKNMNGASGNYTINIDKKQIIHDSFNTGNGDINAEVSSNNDQSISLDFKNIISEIDGAMTKYSEGSMEENALSELAEAAKREDVRGFKAILKSITQFAPEFISNTFSQITAGILLKAMGM